MICFELKSKNFQSGKCDVIDDVVITNKIIVFDKICYAD